MSAKDLRVTPISHALADATIRKYHYSGKTARNSQLHLGVFMGTELLGAMQFGPPLDRSKLMHLVEGTKWSDFVELNRLAFANELPRNAESRALAIAFRLFRKHRPGIKWCVSFADATQCGDGTIYRASGFVLTNIRASDNLARLPDGTVIHKMSLESSMMQPRAELQGRSYSDVTEGKYNFAKYVSAAGATVLPGFQLRYIKFIDPTWRTRLTVPEIPFSRIAEMGASMYLGVSSQARAEVVGSPGPPAKDVRSDPCAPILNGQNDAQ